jgi:hypothetical protein
MKSKIGLLSAAVAAMLVASTNAEDASALSTDELCGAASADRTYTSLNSSFTSPATYAAGKNGCSRAYFVRINDYRTGNETRYNYFEYGGQAPAILGLESTSQCVQARLMVYVYEVKADGTKFIDHKSVSGVPQVVNGVYQACTLPRVVIDSSWLELTTGKNYQFAVSARNGADFIDSPAMQPIKMGRGNL